MLGEKSAFVNGHHVAGQGTAFVLHLVDIQLKPEFAVNFESSRRSGRECITTTCGSSGKIYTEGDSSSDSSPCRLTSEQQEQKGESFF